MKRILHLTLYRRWFDLIASGKKPVDYRQASPHWRKRIFDENGFPKRFDEIHFRNGYGADRPLMVTEFGGAMITHADLCTPGNGEKLSGLTIVILVGKKLRFENYTSDVELLRSI